MRCQFSETFILKDQKSVLGKQIQVCFHEDVKNPFLTKKQVSTLCLEHHTATFMSSTIVGRQIEWKRKRGKKNPMLIINH